jgi:hypothetical protein
MLCMYVPTTDLTSIDCFSSGGFKDPHLNGTSFLWGHNFVVSCTQKIEKFPILLV